MVQILAGVAAGFSEAPGAAELAGVRARFAEFRRLCCRRPAGPRSPSVRRPILPGVGERVII